MQQLMETDDDYDLKVMPLAVYGERVKNTNAWIICRRKHTRGSPWLAEMYSLSISREECINFFNDVRDTDEPSFEELERRGLAKCVPCRIAGAL